MPLNTVWGFHLQKHYFVYSPEKCIPGHMWNNNYNAKLLNSVVGYICHLILYQFMTSGSRIIIFFAHGPRKLTLPCDLKIVTKNLKIKFLSHTDNLLAKRNSRLFLMRKLRSVSLNCAGLKFFSVTNIRSILLCSAPAWYTLLSDQNKTSLEKTQRGQPK